MPWLFLLSLGTPQVMARDRADRVRDMEARRAAGPGEDLAGLAERDRALAAKRGLPPAPPFLPRGQWKQAYDAKDRATLEKVCSGAVQVCDEKYVELWAGLQCPTSGGTNDTFERRQACAAIQSASAAAKGDCNSLTADFLALTHAHALEAAQHAEWGKKFMACKKTAEMFEKALWSESLFEQWVLNLDRGGVPIEDAFRDYIRENKGSATLDARPMVPYFKKKGSFPYCAELVDAVKSAGPTAQAKALDLLAYGHCAAAIPFALAYLNPANPPKVVATGCRHLAGLGTAHELKRIQAAMAGRDENVRRACTGAMTAIRNSGR